MLIISGTFEVDPSDRDAFIANRVEMMERSRAEDGCIAYAFTADAIEPGRVLLFERWESADALRAHLAGFKDNPPPRDGIKVHASEILQHDVSATGPIHV